MAGRLPRLGFKARGDLEIFQLFLDKAINFPCKTCAALAAQRGQPETGRLRAARSSASFEAWHGSRKQHEARHEDPNFLSQQVLGNIMISSTPRCARVPKGVYDEV